MPPNNTGKKYKKRLPEPEPVLSPAANKAMDTIAPIFQLNQDLYHAVGSLQMLLMNESFTQEVPVPKLEKGLMESVSLIQIENAKLINQLVKIRVKLIKIMEKHSESNETGDNQ